MPSMLTDLKARDLLRPIVQFLNNLLGENGQTWWESFKKFLRKELFEFGNGLLFDPIDWYERCSPTILALKAESDTSRIQQGYAELGMRMGTTEELLMFLAYNIRLKREEFWARILVPHGPGNQPCYIEVLSRGDQHLEIKILDSWDSQKWPSGSKFLTFPVAK